VTTSERQVDEVLVDADGTVLSGLLALPDSTARALIVALPGGGLRAAYFHGSAHPDQSLLTLGATLGFAALALDRPGYGASAESLPEGMTLGDQAGTIAAAVERFRDVWGVDAPLFFVGQSAGMQVAIHVAADHAAGLDLVGLACSGSGLRYHPDLGDGQALNLSAAQRANMFWGPRELYPPGTLERRSTVVGPVPLKEGAEASAWPTYVAALAARVSVPVMHTVADHERWWDTRSDTLETFRELFVASPRMEIDIQVDAGHNLSLGRTARAHHLRVLAFASECLLTKERT
jgi:pimeloyl-ACP methyl ester carboxylesterase